MNLGIRGRGFRRSATLLGTAALLASSCAVSPTAGRREVVGPALLSAQPAGSGERFLGSNACRRCHPEAWMNWNDTGHAGSFASLPGTDARNPACLRCHATAYGDPRGYRDPDRTPDLGAVGCEACHGAGGPHVLSRHPELVPTTTGGDCPPCEINRICRLCHTPEHSPGFDLSRDLRRVTCRPNERIRISTDTR